MMFFVHRASRRGAAAILIFTASFLVACGGEVSPSSTTTKQVDLSKAAAASFSAHGSVEQVYVTGADAGMDLELVDANGSIDATGTADTEGALIFRDVKPGAGYEVATGSGASLAASKPVAVMAPGDTPPLSFYHQQQIGPGYGYLETRDGTTLAINVILPGPPENGPYPTVIEYSGYDPANPDAPQPSTLITSALGYAAVGVNMRGTGCSGGAFQFFETLQSTDGYDAVETIAAQPWVKGNKVGMVGISYPGISQLFVAQMQPPHLAAIAPLSVISDMARGILFPGGIFNNGFAKDWALDRQHDAMPYGQPWSQKRRDEGDQTCIANQQLRGQTPDLLTMINENKFYKADVVDPISPITFVHKITVPVFLAGAWQDEQVGGYFPNMLDKFTGTTKVHFTITNGGHTDSLDPAIFSRWTEFLSFYVAEEIPSLPAAAQLILQVLGDQVFGVPRLRAEPDRFTDAPSFAAALASFEAEPKVRLLFENGAGGQPGAPVAGFERSFEQWPIAGLQPTIWYFADGGRLGSALPTGNGADAYIYDPANAQRTNYHGGGNDIWKALPAWDWQPLAAGKAVAYATDPLTEPLVMAGPGSVDLWLMSTAKDTDLQVSLSEIRPDGQEVYIQSGWLRASHRKIDPQASSILRPVQSHLEQDVADLPPGQFVEARVELFPFAAVFRAGSRVRISVESPGGDRALWKFDALPTDGQVINTIGHAAAAPSRIVLPVVPGIEVTTPLPPCPGLRGQPCRAYQELSDTPG